MFEIIKSLSPKQRLTAFIFTVLISSVVSILTIYLKTDDCSALSDQYTKLVSNQAKLMEVNDKLVSEYNGARNDLIVVNAYLKTMDSIYKNEYVAIRNTQMQIRSTSSSEPDDGRRDSIYHPIIKPRFISPSNEMTDILDSLKKLTSKYKKKE